MNNHRDPADYVIGNDVEVSDVDLTEEEIYLDGQRLTDERVEQMAQRSVALAREREANLIPGGKSLSGDGKHSPVVQVRVSEATRDGLRRIAVTRRVSVSKLSRQVLAEFVEAHHGEVAP